MRPGPPPDGAVGEGDIATLVADTASTATNLHRRHQRTAPSLDTLLGIEGAAARDLLFRVPGHD